VELRERRKGEKGGCVWMLGRRIVCARSGEEDCVGRLRAEAGDPEKKSVWRLCGRRAGEDR